MAEEVVFNPILPFYKNIRGTLTSGRGILVQGTTPSNFSCFMLQLQNAPQSPSKIFFGMEVTSNAESSDAGCLFKRGKEFCIVIGSLSGALAALVNGRPYARVKRPNQPNDITHMIIAGNLNVQEIAFVCNIRNYISSKALQAIQPYTDPPHRTRCKDTVALTVNKMCTADPEIDQTKAPSLSKSLTKSYDTTKTDILKDSTFKMSDVRDSKESFKTTDTAGAVASVKSARLHSLSLPIGIKAKESNIALMKACKELKAKTESQDLGASKSSVHSSPAASRSDTIPSSTKKASSKVAWFGNLQLDMVHDNVESAQESRVRTCVTLQKDETGKLTSEASSYPDIGKTCQELTKSSTLPKTSESVENSFPAKVPLNDSTWKSGARKSSDKKSIPERKSGDDESGRKVSGDALKSKGPVLADAKKSADSKKTSADDLKSKAPPATESKKSTKAKEVPDMDIKLPLPSSGAKKSDSKDEEKKGSMDDLKSAPKKATMARKSAEAKKNKTRLSNDSLKSDETKKTPGGDIKLLKPPSQSGSSKPPGYKAHKTTTEDSIPAKRVSSMKSGSLKKNQSKIKASSSKVSFTTQRKPPPWKLKKSSINTSPYIMDRSSVRKAASKSSGVQQAKKSKTMSSLKSTRRRSSDNTSPSKPDQNVPGEMVNAMAIDTFPVSTVAFKGVELVARSGAAYFRPTVWEDKSKEDVAATSASSSFDIKGLAHFKNFVVENVKDGQALEEFLETGISVSDYHKKHFGEDTAKPKATSKLKHMIGHLTENIVQSTKAEKVETRSKKRKCRRRSEPDPSLPRDLWPERKKKSGSEKMEEESKNGQQFSYQEVSENDSSEPAVVILPRKTNVQDECRENAFQRESSGSLKEQGEIPSSGKLEAVPSSEVAFSSQKTSKDLKPRFANSGTSTTVYDTSDAFSELEHKSRAKRRNGKAKNLRRRRKSPLEIVVRKSSRSVNYSNGGTEELLIDILADDPSLLDAEFSLEQRKPKMTKLGSSSDLNLVDVENKTVTKVDEKSPLQETMKESVTTLIHKCSEDLISQTVSQSHPALDAALEDSWVADREKRAIVLGCSLRKSKMVMAISASKTSYKYEEVDLQQTMKVVPEAESQRESKPGSSNSDIPSSVSEIARKPMTKTSIFSNFKIHHPQKKQKRTSLPSLVTDSSIPVLAERAKSAETYNEGKIDGAEVDQVESSREPTSNSNASKDIFAELKLLTEAIRQHEAKLAQISRRSKLEFAMHFKTVEGEGSTSTTVEEAEPKKPAEEMKAAVSDPEIVQSDSAPTSK
ncbi:unnamed protein product [Cyprideis torosa]|uniref:Uncharacterized protein n=1 Tax=Cyprideis torosa TaxID=163714 RepID=A0A7R8W756_9CRUS|nr:unnamed protein product [Cyprideis torosa]CAG0885924.1 unnamed protein product [Cyprideis torosa]